MTGPTILEQLNLELSAVVEKVRPSLVQVRNRNGHGTGAGTIWHTDGLIITNAHVVRQDTVEVIIADQEPLSAKVLAHDPNRDLAALSVEAHNLPVVHLGDSKNLQPGQLVMALGHPWGVAGAVSAGPVIHIGPPPELRNLTSDFIQAGLQLRPGHSGGPMVDTWGQLVGINTMITGPEVGLAIPLHIIKEFLQETLGTPVTVSVDPNCRINC